jgi:CheY-like chemotaxis protein
MPTLLLADESVTTQRVIALTFADESFRVVTVSDGQQAIDAMAAARPDIVLAGTSLPRTNGYELAVHMRSQRDLRDVPLLLLSGAFETVDEARLKASGARGVMEKPLEPTAVISRVKELLGFKDVGPTTPAGRLVTPADPPVHQASPPVSNPPVSSWDELRHESGLAPDAQSVEGAGSGAARADYLGTLDAAFDSLDLHLSGVGPAEHSRNPSPPLGQASGAPDPRSPGRRPSPRVDGPPANTVFEADSDWFAHDPHADTTAAAHDMTTDLHAAVPARPDTASASPAFETDDGWFAADEKARENRRAQERELASEMGIRDLALPEREPVPAAPAPAGDLDLDFGLEPVAPPEPPSPRAVPDPQLAPPAASALPMAAAPVAPVPVTSLPPTPPGPPASVADDFAALLALETGDAAPNPEPPPVIKPEVGGVRVMASEMTEGMLDQIVYRVAERLRSSAIGTPPPQAMSQAVPPPQITDAMLQQIAQQVTDRLKSGVFASQLHDAVAASVRDTVRSVVSDTSERLVREEIERIKARTET